jgi:hypothetical protein
MSRQSESIARIRASRRAGKLCLWCGQPSPLKLVCVACRPPGSQKKAAQDKLSPAKLSAIRRAAALTRRRIK